jgi:predicted dinucleotide-binding enzyme
MRIAVLGAGRVGGTLGGLWAKRGHEVVLAFARDAAKLERTAAEAGCSSAEPADAVASAEVVLLAVPSEVMDDAVAAAGALDGKILIDATNYGGADGSSGAERVAEMVPGARVIKAINTVFEPMYPLAAEAPGRAHMLIAGDDDEAKEVVASLLRDLGFDPVDAGLLGAARGLEAFAALVIDLAYRRGRVPFAYRFATPGDL